MIHTTKLLLKSVILAVISLPAAAFAQTPDPTITSIVEDTAAGTTLDTQVDQSGSIITIGGGRLDGSFNLFHSFEDFRLGSGMTASFIDTFSESPDNSQIFRVISRVTGTLPSNIFGTIRSEIPRANFYFLNPNGIFIGPGAKLPAGGTFSTADYVRLGDVTFSVDPSRDPAGGTIVAFPFVAAFGFLDEEWGPITIQGMKQNGIVDDSDRIFRPLRLVGGSIKVSDTSILARGSSVDTDGNSDTSDASITIHGSDVSIINSSLRTQDSEISIAAESGDVLIDRASISASTFDGSAGSNLSVSIKAPNGTIELDRGTVASQKGSRSGSGGSVDLDAPNIVLRNDSLINVSGPVSGAKVTIDANSFEMFGSGINAQATPNNTGGTVLIDTGPDGFIRLVDSEITATAGAQSTDARGGVINLLARFIVLQGNPTGDPRTIIESRATTGAGGNIRLAADAVFASGGQIRPFLRADSQTGTSGTVEVDTLTNDITSAISPLDPSFLDASSLIRPSCAARATSGREGSFSVARASASPSTAEGLALSFDAKGLAVVALEESEEPPSGRQVIPAPAPVAAPAEPLLAAEPATIQVAMADVSSTTRGIRRDRSETESKTRVAQRALEDYRQRAESARKVGRRADLVLALSNQARAAIELSRFDGVQPLLSEAKQTVDALGSSPLQVYLGIHVARSYEALAKASVEYRQRGMLAAHAALTEARTRAQKLDSPRALSFTLGNLGSLYQDEHRTNEALVATRRALKAAERAQSPESLYRWHWQEAQLLWEQGKAQEAIASYRRAVDLLEATRQEALAQEGGASEVYFRQLVAPVYLDLVNALVESSGRVKARESEAQLLAEARSTMERFKAAELRDYFHDECAADLEAVTASLDTILDRSEGTAVIYPIVLPSRLELLVSLPGGGIERHTVAARSDEVEAQVRALRTALDREEKQARSAEDADDAYRAPSQQLYRWLVAPYEKQLIAKNVKTLVFVPDGSLRTIPMAALHDGSRFLLERYAVAVTPGLSLVDPRPLDRKSAKLLLAGVSTGSGNLPPLPAVPEELAAIQSIYGGEVLLNQDFQQSRFEQELQETKPSVVHLATHAEFTGDPATSYLLAGDGKLTLKHLAELVGPTQYRQPLELLVLSACETAAGNDRAALGLAGVAIRAGARSAMGSLWAISDEATSQLVTRFYENLKDEQLSKAEALRRAQLALLTDASGRYQHPSYWSPYLLISNWM